MRVRVRMTAGRRGLHVDATAAQLMLPVSTVLDEQRKVVEVFATGVLRMKTSQLTVNC